MSCPLKPGSSATAARAQASRAGGGRRQPMRAAVRTTMVRP